jgi:geranylgeranyl diphosphate synthase type II
LWLKYQTYLPKKTPDPHPLDEVHKYVKEDEYFWKTVVDYPERQGKYVRPTLVMLVSEALGVPKEKAALTACAMQCSEDWILVHDDIQDNSEERRGKPAAHKIYGINQAMNGADALHIIMWRMILDNYNLIGAEKGRKIADEFYKMLVRTVMGQSVEMKWTDENRMDLSDDDAFFVIGGKTAYYTIAGPLRLGAILGGANESQLKSLFDFGIPLGRCFQIRDDLLDLTSDFEGQKKQIGNDIYEGKRTIMLMHLFRTITGTDKEKLHTIMKKTREHKTAEEVTWVIEAMKKYGSLDYGQKLAEKLAEQAKAELEKLTWIPEGDGKKKLRMAIEFILTLKG